ncbi:hypothetical protein LJC24_00330, partial [Desulfococcaceae bacterium OttesenSCG-928-F15]|nr:hypothetical protein [Desulfococcaceae bacterium OttesenSCG-928-F15]
LLDQCIFFGEEACVDGEFFSEIYGGFAGKKAGELWKGWYKKLRDVSSELLPVATVLEEILSAGTLSSRIRKTLGENPSQRRILDVYQNLCRHLEEGKVFIPE